MEPAILASGRPASAAEAVLSFLALVPPAAVDPWARPAHRRAEADKPEVAEEALVAEPPPRSVDRWGLVPRSVDHWSTLPSAAAVAVACGQALGNQEVPIDIPRPSRRLLPNAKPFPFRLFKVQSVENRFRQQLIPLLSLFGVFVGMYKESHLPATVLKKCPRKLHHHI